MSNDIAVAQLSPTRKAARNDDEVNAVVVNIPTWFLQQSDQGGENYNDHRFVLRNERVFSFFPESMQKHLFFG